MSIQSTQKILVISPAWIGDAVMAQTLFKLIKQRHSSAIIDVLAPDWCRALFSYMPEVNQIFVSPFNHGELRLIKRYQLAKQLTQQHYDQAIVLPRSFKSALIPYFAKIPKRTGWLGEFRYGLLNDIRYLNKERLPLMVQQFAALGLATTENLPALFPYPQLQISVTDSAMTLQQFNLTTTKRVLVFCPGAEYGPAKRWPAEYFATVAKNKAQENWDIWLLGSNKDQAIAAKIQEISENVCVDLAGKTNLLQAIHLLSLATAVVSNDSGLMHVAAALQKPMIVLYGSSSPKFTPPLSQQAKILSLNLSCSPCFARECPLKHFKCMRDLSPQYVLENLKSLSY